MAAIEVKSEITGTVCKVLVKEGDRVSEEDALMILESMKMEIPLVAPEEGVVREIRIREGSPISDGDVAVVLDT